MARQAPIAPTAASPSPAPTGRVPRHIAIIMDGNGRWAQARGLPRAAGHDAGTENIRRIVRAAVDLGVEYLTLWAFSTENWKRPPDEVRWLMTLLARSIERELDELDRDGARLRHIGSLAGLEESLRQAVVGAIERTRDNHTIVLTLAFNYGGRAEILHAVKRLLEDRVDPAALDEALFAQYLDTHDLPDPDLIVRTAGEFRFSGYLPWQAVYAEYWSAPICWPDFGPDELRAAVAVYAARERKFGAIPVADAGCDTPGGA
ncbi:MAG TPA: polyprenyl diphosphate synthase [Thermomicrobiales bacterium]|nr:polyprenyl diphosphate synthase [Thermomicrobiales bacterium]